MSRFKTDFKDEIPIGEVRLYDLIDENGAYIGKGVKLVRANGNVQEGDVFGAEEANEIFKCLEGLFDGSEIVTNAVNATNAPNGLTVGEKEDDPKQIVLWCSSNRYIQIYGTEKDGFRIRLRDGAGNALGVILSSDANGRGYVYEAQNATKLGNQPISYFATQFAMDHFQKYVLLHHDPNWRVSPSDGFKMISFSDSTCPNGMPDFNILERTGNGYPRPKEAGIYEVWVDRIQASAPVSLVINKMSLNTVMDVCVSGHAIMKMSAYQYFDIALATNTANVSITYANVSIRRVA